MWVINQQALIILGVAVAIVGLVAVALLIGPAPNELAEVPVESAIAGTSPVADTPQAQTSLEQPAPTSTTNPSEQQAISAEPANSAPQIDGTIAPDEYAHAMEAGGFQVYWSNNESLLRVGLRSPGTGYIAIGFDPDHRMQGANYILCAVRNGQVVTRDDFGTGPLAHSSDVANGGRDNVLEAAGTERNGQTTVEFVIPLDSGDPMDKPLMPGSTYQVLVAYHNSSDDFSDRHSQRGVGEIRLE